MGTDEKFEDSSREFAQRFLRTAVVVDDEAYMAPDGNDGPRAELVVPDRRVRTSVQEDQSPAGKKSVHALNARSIMDAFSSLGVICGVVGPAQSEMEAVRQADIVVLDWLLRDGKSDYTVTLLRKMLTEERDRNSLRLVAIYTGEARLEDIYQIVFDELKNSELDPKDDENKTTIAYRHGRLVIYAKPEVSLAPTLKGRSVAEKDLPGKLLGDFSSMTEGLLPGIALTSLTAVREGEHKILDRFCAELDPAFLAHMACLPHPEDAERQIVAHVAEELRGLADEAVAAVSPAGKRAVERWIRHDGRASFEFGERELDLQQTVKLVTKGLKASDLKESAFKNLSVGFAGCAVDSLDERLAWIMSFRTVYNAPPPILWLGSVVTTKEDGDDKHLICMRPKCDSVRLKDETTFVLLPLVEPLTQEENKDEKKREEYRKRMVKEQIVARIDKEFTRLGIGLDPSGWVLRRFQPTEGNRAVTATRRQSDDGFEFTDTLKKKYVWQGEFKAEYAQRIARVFADALDRVEVDESEWLRRMAKRP